MAEPITDERLAELHTLAAAASEGPWVVSDPNEGSEHGPLWHVHNDAYVNPHLTEDEAESGFGAIIELGWRKDAEFIAAARTAVPELLAEVERLRAQLAAADQYIKARNELGDQIHAAVLRQDEELTATRNALADCVVKATEYGDQDGGFVAMYILPTGPIHRAIPMLDAVGINVRPGFDGRKPRDLADEAVDRG